MALFTSLSWKMLSNLEMLGTIKGSGLLKTTDLLSQNISRKHSVNETGLEMRMLLASKALSFPHLFPVLHNLLAVCRRLKKIHK